MNYAHPTYITPNVFNGFTMGLSGDPNAWRSFVVSTNIAAAVRKTVERKRREGTDPGHTVSPQRMQIKRDKLPAKRPHSESKAARMREALKNGPRTGSELGALVGIETKAVRQYLAHCVDNGSVVILNAKRPVRYALARAM